MSGMISSSKKARQAGAPSHSVERFVMTTRQGEPTGNGCIFCAFDPARLIGHNDLAFAIFDRFPVTDLHVLIIPRRHEPDYLGLSPEEVQASHMLLREVSVALHDRDLSIAGFNIGINIGEAAGQTISHAHLHLIPRRRGDVPEPRGGVRNVIPGKSPHTL